MNYCKTLATLHRNGINTGGSRALEEGGTTTDSKKTDRTSKTDFEIRHVATEFGASYVVPLVVSKVINL